jgi:hypothetical protein
MRNLKSMRFTSNKRYLALVSVLKDIVSKALRMEGVLARKYVKWSHYSYVTPGRPCCSMSSFRCQ